MSRAIKWTLPFQSKNGTNYTLNIYEENYSGAAITLRGASRPFYTQEDNDEDYFKPVRTQSGYIRIVYSKALDNYDWEELIPDNNHHHYVELLQGTTVKWMGYMKAEGYDHDAFQYVEELEFPVISSVASIEGFELSYLTSDHGMRTVGWLLHHCLSMAGVTFDKCWFSRTTDRIKELDLYLDSLNFMEINESYDSTIPESDNNRRFNAKLNCLEIIEEICGYFGWTLHETGKDIIFKANEFDKYIYSLPFAQLKPGHNYDIWNAIAKPAAISPTYISTKHRFSHIVAAKSATIETDVNEIDTLISMPFDEWPSFGDGNPRTQQYANFTTYLNYFDWYFTSSRGQWNVDIDQKFKNVRFKTTRASSNNGINLFKYDSCKNSEKSSKYNFAMTNGLQVVCMDGTNTAWRTSCSIETNDQTVITGGALCITGSVRGNGNMSSQDAYLSANLDDKQMAMYVSIGNWYYNGSTWTTTRSSIIITFKDGQIKTENKSLSMWQYNGATGYVIPIGGGVYAGNLKLEFETPTINGITSLVFTSLNVKHIIAHQYNNSNKTKNVYVSRLQTTASKEIKKSFMLSSYDNNPNGRGILHNSNWTYLTSLEYIGRSTRPEFMLRERMSYWHIKPQKKIEVNVSLIDNSKYGTISVGTEIYNILSSTVDWVEDEMIIMAEKTNNTFPWQP